LCVAAVVSLGCAAKHAPQMVPAASMGAPGLAVSHEDDEAIRILITGDSAVTLIDPNGRRDEMVNGRYVAGIPGCERWDVTDFDVEGPPNSDSGPGTIALHLSSPLPGPYRLRLDSTSSHWPLSILVDVDARSGASCRDVYDGPRVETLCVRWSAKGERCWVRIVPCDD
jgi:hypothetical protein